MSNLKIKNILFIISFMILQSECSKTDSDVRIKPELNNKCSAGLSFPIINEEAIYSRWVMIYNINDSNCIKNFEPEKDAFPITLNFKITSDTIWGKHDPNTYKGKFHIDSNKIIFKIIEITDVFDSKYYWDFLNNLDTNYISLNNDSLFLYSKDTTFKYCFIKEENWNKNHKDIDSIYYW